MRNHKKQEKLERATVRFVKRGEQHPYVLEVTTPGWRGCDATLRAPKRLPQDLEEIRAVLDRAGVRTWDAAFTTSGVMIFNADGTTEFVLKDFTDVEAALPALVAAGWMLPGMPLEAPIH